MTSSAERIPTKTIAAISVAPEHAVARRDARVERPLRDPPVDELRSHDRDDEHPDGGDKSAARRETSSRSIRPSRSVSARGSRPRADASTRPHPRRPASRARPPRRRAAPGKSSRPRSRSLTTTPSASSSPTAAAASLRELLELALRSVQVARGVAAAVAADREDVVALGLATSSRMRARTATRRSATGRTCSSALLASRGVNRRFGTAPTHGRADTKRLAQWLVLVAVLIAPRLRLADRRRASPTRRSSTSGRPPSAASSRTRSSLALVLAIARCSRPLLALRRPASVWSRRRSSSSARSFAIYVFEPVYAGLVASRATNRG